MWTPRTARFHRPLSLPGRGSIEPPGEEGREETDEGRAGEYPVRAGLSRGNQQVRVDVGTECDDGDRRERGIGLERADEGHGVHAPRRQVDEDERGRAAWAASINAFDVVTVSTRTPSAAAAALILDAKIRSATRA